MHLKTDCSLQTNLASTAAVIICEIMKKIVQVHFIKDYVIM